MYILQFPHQYVLRAVFHRVARCHFPSHLPQEINIVPITHTHTHRTHGGYGRSLFLRIGKVRGAAHDGGWPRAVGRGAVHGKGSADGVKVTIIVV